MSWLDFVLLLAAALWLAVSLFFLLRRKSGGCSGQCDRCARHCNTEK